VLECFLCHLGECRFNANECLVDNNYKSSSTPKKGLVTPSETLVRINEPVCFHMPEVRNLDGRRTKAGNQNRLFMGWHKPLRHVISYTAIHIPSVSQLALSTYWHAACARIYHPGNARRSPESLEPLTHETHGPYWKILRAVTGASFMSLPCGSKFCLLCCLPAAN
jgi:hypothetical protein